ncbi:MAG TPA: hypothetical protein PLT09_00285 [Deltaproteobacteria bacterium]|nr:hypothetical protein [Deltaproteobacteria bacterium]HPR54243.1 hypothetical protein [Deltaproteobacteria bacterium]HXK45845.1 hypothetical protein [Deltaproteobacteria bacterium]
MRKILVLCMGALLIGTTAYAKDFAIIKNAMFGGQKIEVYRSLKDALENYTGEGKIYEIILTPVPLRRVESKKKIEVSEFTWTVDDRYGKTEKAESGEKAGKAQKNSTPKK